MNKCSNKTQETGSEKIASRNLGRRTYELKDHLGNVRVTLSDALAYNANTSTMDAQVKSYTNYYPFGMMQYSNSSMANNNYRFGFNGKEMDNETSGTGNQYDYGFRIYNPRIAKFLSVDPLTKSYPWYTPYQFAGNKPIEAIDLDGLEDFHVNSVTITGEILKLKLETAEGIKELRHKVNYWSNKKFLHTKEGHDHLMDITGNKDLTWRVCTDYNFYGHTGMRVYGLAKNGKEFLIYDDMKEKPGAFSKGPIKLEHNFMEGPSDGGLGGTSTQTEKDKVVGLGVVGTIFTGGAILEGGFTLAGLLSAGNSLDDALGAFTNGNGSLTQDIASEKYKGWVNNAKLGASLLSITKGGKDIFVALYLKMYLVYQALPLI